MLLGCFPRSPRQTAWQNCTVFSPPEKRQIEKGPAESNGWEEEYYELLRKAAQYGLPVEILRVVERDVTIKGSGVNEVKPRPPSLICSFCMSRAWANQPAGRSRRGKTLDGFIIRNVYHEITPLWFDFMSSDPEVVGFVAEQVPIGHDWRAPVESGGGTSDPHRLFMEAAAIYVENRVQSWWSALRLLSVGSQGGRI